MTREAWTDWAAAIEKDSPSQRKRRESELRFLELLRPASPEQILQAQIIGAYNQLTCTCQCPVHGRGAISSLFGGIFG
jgi:hypothetical protein